MNIKYHNSSYSTWLFFALLDPNNEVCSKTNVYKVVSSRYMLIQIYTQAYQFRKG